jgi:hypothetical protein
MSDASRLLEAAAAGDRAAAELPPLVYDERRKFAVARSSVAGSGTGNRRTPVRYH